MYRQSGTNVRGVLNDFDLTLDMDKLASYPPHLLRPTGTTPFLAREFFDHKSYVPHLLRHDLESAMYVLIWDAVRNATNESGHKHEYLRDWSLPDASESRKGQLHDYLISRRNKLPLGQMEPIRKCLAGVAARLFVGYARMSKWLGGLERKRVDLDDEEQQHFEDICGEFDVDDIIRRFCIMKTYFPAKSD